MAFEYQGFATLGVNLNRQKYGPLDISAVFNNETDFEWYVSKGTKNASTKSSYWDSIVPYPYPGLIAAVILADGISVRVVTDESGNWVEVGAKTLGDDKTITLSDEGVLSLKNFGVQYYAYGEDGNYTLTTGFKAGLQPQVHEVSSGVYEIAWYEPSSTTVEGLASRLSTLETRVDNTYTKADVYTKTEIDAKLGDIPEWGTIS